MQPVKTNYHTTLASYFASKPLYLDEPIQKKPNTRKLVEQPWQQTNAKLWDDVTKTLCDLKFIEAKNSAGLLYGLIAEFKLVLTKLPESIKIKQKELESENNINRYIEDINKFSNGSISNINTISTINPISNDEIQRENEKIIGNITRFDKIKAFSQFVNFESHGMTRFGSMPGFIIQQAYNSSFNGPVAISAKSQLLKSTDVLLLQIDKQRSDYNSYPGVISRLGW